MKKQNLKDFLSRHLQDNSKLLLGLSGGPDSMALLFFLVECLPIFNFSLHLAHVDHGWRKESKKEAEFLQILAKQLRLPFHLDTLQITEGGNLENRCREGRLSFFKKLNKKYNFQALLLAHHSGDQSETVIKRVFEGAGLKAIGGLRAVRCLEGLPIWRPLLSFSKEELICYLDRKCIRYFEDPTNHDSIYLRSRMREKMFPEIERFFGKNIQKNCVRLGYLCQELSDYLDEKISLIRKKVISGPFGDYLPIDFHPVELKFFLKEYAKGAHLSYEALELIMKLIKLKRTGKKVHAPPLIFYLYREYLFILKQPFPNFFSETTKWKRVKQGGWKNFWKGKVAFPDKVEMECFAKLAPPLRKKIKKWYTYHRVPPIFYDCAPIFIKKGEIVGECLTGYDINNLQ